MASGSMGSDTMAPMRDQKTKLGLTASSSTLRAATRASRYSRRKPQASSSVTIPSRILVMRNVGTAMPKRAKPGKAR